MKYKTSRSLLLALAGGIFMLSESNAEEAYLAPPRFVKAPGPDHALEGRKFQGIPSLAISLKGRLWATWYAGKTPAEDRNNYVVVATSGDRGKTWTEHLVVDPDGEGPVRAFDPQLWLAPDGHLWLFWAQGLDDAKLRMGLNGVWAMIGTNPDRGDVQWSAPRRLCDGVMMCKPLVLSSGEWVLPVSFWHRRKASSAGVVVSTDQGQTWRERGACDVPVDVRNHDEHMVVEKRDGSLWMLARSNDGIGESISKDRGKTWSTLTPSSIAHPPARFFVRRLNSGNLLLVKHGPLRKKTGRSHLTAYLSKDDGITWSDGLLLDERQGISYPDGQQVKDGSIYIIYDRDRMGACEILMAKFTEKDLVDDTPDSKTVSYRIIVSKPPEKRE